MRLIQALLSPVTSSSPRIGLGSCTTVSILMNVSWPHKRHMIVLSMYSPVWLMWEDQVTYTFRGAIIAGLKESHRHFPNCISSCDAIYYSKTSSYYGKLWCLFGQQDLYRVKKLFLVRVF